MRKPKLPSEGQAERHKGQPEARTRATFLLRLKALFSRQEELEIPSRADAWNRMLKARDLFDGRPIREFRFGNRETSEREALKERPAQLPQSATKR